MNYTKEDIERIQQATEGRLLDVITRQVELRKKGASYTGKCPVCLKASFEYHDGKKIFKCFKCDFAGNSPVSFHMKQGKTYPEALQALADQFNVYIDEPVRSTKKVSKKTPAKPADPEQKEPAEAAPKSSARVTTYCARMLAESGLTTDDVEAKVFYKDLNRTTTISHVFKSGTVNSLNSIVDGDDVIIEYYDLKGAPVMYEQMLKGKSTGKLKEYFRVRWQFPDEHLDKNGKPYKYKSPTGSGSFIYIPQVIRDIYKSGGKIERLFVQEGEKKAEKACKHGVLSVAVSGIHNMGRNGRLHEDLVRIIQACDVKELVLLFDKDWNDISRNIGINDYADQRPKSFFTAAKNFKEYAIQLKNSRSIYLEIYIGNVQPNDRDDKGIDDLLANTLRGHEEDLKADIDFLINERSLTGKFVQLYKITTWADSKLQELWSLHNANEFAQRHKELLKQLPEFRIGKYRWRFNQKGEIESTQPVESEEKYWEEIIKEDRNGNQRTEYRFRYERCFRFLQNRGFYRFRAPSGDYEFIRIEHPVISSIDRHEEIRDFVKDFTREIANEEVLEMLHRGGPQFLGPEKLSNLAFNQNILFEEPRRDKQLLYFKDNYWEIRADEINVGQYSSITHQLWKDQIHDMNAARTERLIEVEKLNDKYFSYRLSETGESSHFLKFLINTSNFTWRKEKNGAEVVDSAEGLDESKVITRQEILENKGHLISKLCAIGYMLLAAKDRSVSKAVVAMDGKQSEVGKSNGRSGKSLIGELFKQVMPAIYINGKHKDIEGDNFLWDELTLKTKVVFIDDVRTNFPFEFLFANITGDWSVNYKGNRRATFPFQQSPKIYMTTNHALNGEGSSFSDRQWKIAFSDYYNDSWKPVDDFGTLFFDEWDFEQWNLTWNLMAECIQLYLRFGVVEAPSERIELRQLRQFISEGFLMWADEYFSDQDHFGTRIPRKVMQEAFFENSPDQRKWVTPTLFKAKIRKYCEFKGYQFNPQRYDPVTGLCMFLDKDGNPDDDDKSGGVEFFTLGYKEDDKPF